MERGVLIPVCANSQPWHPATACRPGAKGLEKSNGGPREGCLEVPFQGKETAEPRGFALVPAHSRAFTPSSQRHLLTLKPRSFFRLTLPINLAKIP